MRVVMAVALEFDAPPTFDWVSLVDCTGCRQARQIPLLIVEAITVLP